MLDRLKESMAVTDEADIVLAIRPINPNDNRIRRRRRLQTHGDPLVKVDKWHAGSETAKTLLGRDVTPSAS